MSALQSASDEELKNELDRREKERERAAWLKKRIAADSVGMHVDILLLMVPEHKMSNCADDRIVNENRGCPRCVLLNVKENNGGFSTYQVTNITFEDIGEEPEEAHPAGDCGKSFADCPTCWNRRER